MSEASKSSRRDLWGTRLGFYFAAIGAAFGLGNVWRFPYVVAENGGGAFVLLYMCFLFLVGLPLLVGELMLGKATRRSVVAALSRLKHPMREEASASKSTKNSADTSLSGSFWAYLMPHVGRASVMVGLIVLAYFAVISGWVLFFVGHAFQGLFLDQNASANQAVDQLMKNGWLQVILTFSHLLFVSLVVAKDVEQGIERWVGLMMPVFGVLMVALAFKTLSLPTSTDAIRFLFYPDFSKLNYSSVSQALGHVFFTLSIGFGSMVTFGSYLRDKVVISRAGFRVTAIDSVISLSAGLLIFPIFLTSASGGSGPELLFRTVPVLFRDISGGRWFGAGFFLCLYLAALGASIGLLETVVSNLADSQKVRREKGAWWAGSICLFFAVLPSLSTSVFQNIRFGKLNLLEICDSLLINWILPVVALLVSQGILYGLSNQVKKAEFFGEDAGEMDSAKERLYSHWVFALKWITPTVVVAALVLQVIGLFKK